MHFFTRRLDHEAIYVNTVHMNKLNLVTRAVMHHVKVLIARGVCWCRGESYDPHPGPRWQQLELPFSRTPVRRWNR